MSPPQIQLYWLTWSKVTRKQGWRGAAVDLSSTRLPCFCAPGAINEAYQQTWEIAHQLAARSGGVVNANTLRHACICVAAGYDKSSKDLSNSEYDRLIAWLRVLANPEDLRAVLNWQDQEAGERRRLLYVINRAPCRYVTKICTDKFGHPDVSRLSLVELRQLALTIRLRWRTQSAARPAVPDTGNPPADHAPGALPTDQEAAHV